MTDCNTFITRLQNGSLDSTMAELYGGEPAVLCRQRSRYLSAIRRYTELYGETEIALYSAPGRTEICGNHTDHQYGRILAASIDLDIIAVVGKSEDQYIDFVSEGYPPVRFSVDDLKLSKEETGTTQALLKGILSGMKEHGYQIGAFRAYVTSDVLSGSGLSSSAALECLIGTIVSGAFNEMQISPLEIALIGQYAENVYFGKPCGLMDQLACCVGDLIQVSFHRDAPPDIVKLPFAPTKEGYSLCIVDTKGSHADLTDDYAAIPAEMRAVSAFWGKDYLSEITLEEFLSAMPQLYGKVHDRAILRAYHFLSENERVEKAAVALREKHFEDFLRIVRASGDSSYRFLQNVYSNKDERHQPLSVALMLSEEYLKEDGVCRVHGGGFAGTIQVYVRSGLLDGYRHFIEDILGPDTCHVLRIRKQGGVRIV